MGSNIIGNNGILGYIKSLLVNILSFSKDAFVITQYENDKIQSGECFTIEEIFYINDADSEYDIVFDTRNCLHKVTALPTFWHVNTGEVTINLGSCSDYSVGTAIIPTNRNGDIINPSDIVFKYDVTPVNHVAGPTNILIGTKSTNQYSGGGSIPGNLPIILKTGIIYVFRISNNAGENIKLYTNISWYET